ncbi:MAG: hypothetical protein QJR14_07540 [Bacillota bacterium]|nr:hypothetical protein [Bacillota bacterium]
MSVMEELQGRIAYLHGLANGLERMDGQTGELMRGILDVLDGLAEELEALREDASELDEYVQSVDEDLAQVENEFWQSAGEEGTDTGSAEGRPRDGGMAEERAGEQATASVECPNCGLVLEFQPSDFADEEGRVELICPNCGEKVRMERGERRERRTGRSGEERGERLGGRARMHAGRRERGGTERNGAVTLVPEERT